MDVGSKMVLREGEYAYGSGTRDIEELAKGYLYAFTTFGDSPQSRSALGDLVASIKDSQENFQDDCKARIEELESVLRDNSDRLEACEEDFELSIKKLEDFTKDFTKDFRRLFERIRSDGEAFHEES